jgi:DNA invertase Pin-like site-specific DNA recombinase
MRQVTMIVGYARVSSSSQKLDIQIEKLKAAGAEKIFAEKLSGTNAARPALHDALGYIREGDSLIVTRLDRLARSVHDLHGILHEISVKKADFRCTEQGGADMTSNTGKLMLAILGAVAEFESGIRKERQIEGIEKAKAAGIYKGRKPSIDRAKLMLLIEQGKGVTEIANELNIGRASIYRILKNQNESAGSVDA